MERSLPFDDVTALLPEALRKQAEGIPTDAGKRAEELRLRVGRPLFIGYPEGEMPVSGTFVRQEDLYAVLEAASGASIHTVMEQIKNGFVPIRGGHRIGLCGTGVIKDMTLTNLRSLSSLSIRVARAYHGIAKELLPRLWNAGELKSTLILSPPGGGKTTLLRELIRCISSGEGCVPRRVGLIDERGELAAMESGKPSLDVGPRTDVMDGCPKDIGLTILLRGLSPQVLAVDEITAAGDVAAMLQAVGCGVTLLATAHGGSLPDLLRRSLYRELVDTGAFERLVTISGEGSDRRYTVTDMEGNPC